MAGSGLCWDHDAWHDVAGALDAMTFEWIQFSFVVMRFVAKVEGEYRGDFLGFLAILIVDSHKVTP